jgi:uncharacterized protein (TIGR03435 family)
MAAQRWPVKVRYHHFKTIIVVLGSMIRTIRTKGRQKMIRATRGTVLAALICWGSPKRQALTSHLHRAAFWRGCRVLITRIENIIRQRFCFLAVGVTVAYTCASAQPVEQNGRIEFEVASIKLNTSGSGAAEFKTTPDRLIVTNGKLADCIESAYGLRQDSEMSRPDWLDTERFDIEAKAPAAASEKDLWVMLQALLVDRFRLRFHTESREMPVYALVPDRGGLKIKRAEPSNGTTTVARFARRLSLMNFLHFNDRLIIDMTGFEGEFEYNFVFHPDTTDVDEL